jgi:hypothetical protein
VLALHKGVRDLEDVEDAHRNVVWEMGERPRHPDEADHPCIAELNEGLDRALVREGLAARRHVDLHEIEVIGSQSPQALLHACTDVPRRIVVGVGHLCVWR